jgi:ankyrin
VDAAQNRNAAAVGALLRRGADPNVIGADGSTALHWAAHWDDIEIADRLIRAGAHVNLANDLGATPLWLACENGSAAMVDHLLKAGADPNVALPSGETSLMTASRSGNPVVVKALLARGARVNASENSRGQSALMWAVAERHPEVVKLLLEGGADVHARTRVRTRVVNTETTGFGKQIVMNVEQGGYTPLLFAAQRGPVETARLLVAAGADVNDTAPEGTSALVVAAHSRQQDVAMFLLEQGADPNADGAGYTALHAAILRNEVPLADALLARGVDPTAILKKGTPARRQSADYVLDGYMVGATPIWLAARFGEPAIARALAAKGADFRFAMKDGTTTVMAAIEMIPHRESGMVDPSADESTVLDLVRLAVAAGANVNAVDKDGNSALHAAVSKHLNSVVRFLCERGADLSARNGKGQTPLALAKGTTVDLLRKLGAPE